MPIVEEVRHQVAIAGAVTDGKTRKAVEKARVEIIAGPVEFTDKVQLLSSFNGSQWALMTERIDRKQTQADGHFHFLDLPAGTYTLKAILPGSGSRYGEVQKNATVAHDTDGNITMATADLSLPPTTLQGNITHGTDPVTMVEVRIKGSGERTFSDGAGNYLLTAVETGQRAVAVSRQGFVPASQNVTLDSPGVEKTLNFTLVEPPP